LSFLPINRSSPIIVLRISKENAVNSFRSGAGPTNPNRAREDFPRSIRATYGTDNTMNAIYASDSVESAKTHIDLFFSKYSTIHTLREDKEKMSPVPQKTVIIIKPGQAEGDVVDKLIQKILWKRFEIVKRETINMSVELASQVYSRYAGYDYFQEMIKYVTSGPVMCLVIKGENSVHDMKILVGERDPAEARKTLPMSIRALFGTDSIRNAVDCSKTAEEALHQMVLLFPGQTDQISRQASARDLNMRTALESRVQSKRPSIVEYPTHIQFPDPSIVLVEDQPAVKTEVEVAPVADVVQEIPELVIKEQTIALIKPDAFDRKDQILSRIKLEDFTIVGEKEILLSRELAEQFYAEHKGKAFYEQLLEFMCR